MPDGGATIVVVGATDAVSERLAALLQADGHRVSSTPCMDDIGAALRQAPALIVLDISASARQGRALVRTLRAAPSSAPMPPMPLMPPMPPMPLIPLVLLHANATRRARLAALAAGADEVISALDGAELRLRVRNLLRRRSAAASVPAPPFDLQLAQGTIEAALIDALPASIALIDRAGTLVSVNQAWRRFAADNGMPVSSQFGIGSNYLAVCEPPCHGAHGAHGAHSDGAAVAPGIRAVLDGSMAQFLAEYPCHLPQRQRWFLMTVAPLGAGPQGAIVMHEDVTQKYLAKQSLDERNMQFGQMAAHIRDIFFLIHVASGRLLYVSPAYDDIVGRPAAELADHPAAWQDVILPEHRARVAADYAAHVHAHPHAQGNAPFECVFQIRRPDQALRWLSLKLFQIREEDGTVTRMAGIAQDITDRKIALRTLRESERRFFELLNNTSMLAVMLDLDAHITFCNRALLTLMSLDSEQVVGNNWFTVFTGAGAGAGAHTFLAQLAQGAAESRHESEIVKQDGERRLISWSTSVLHDVDGAVIGTASIGEDITEQKKSEQKILRLNANLEKLSTQLLRVQEQERISLARELHDELGQHLALLKIDLHHLRASLNDAAAFVQWEKIDGAVVALIAQIRLISVSLRPPTLDYLGLESALRQLLERQFGSGACRCVFEYAGLPARLAPPVEIALYRIVQESTTNIVRHARATSVVVELNGGESGHELELLVRDNGIGFVRAAAIEGDGHGLRGMEERITLLGGRFDIASSPAGGTRIAVALLLEPA